MSGQRTTLNGQGVCRCEKSGAMGCDSNDSTDRNFYAGKCMKCGRSGLGRDRVSWSGPIK